MLMAARKLQGIGLVLLVLMFAMILYLLSVNVAATRSQLTRINDDIAKTRDSIRYLESEYAVRASMRQLERWNADSFGYAAPVAGQYLHGERELASLDQLPRARGANDVAPVLMAMVSPVDLTREGVAVDGAAPVTDDAAPSDVAKRHRAKLGLIEDRLLAAETLAARDGEPAKAKPQAGKLAPTKPESSKPASDKPASAKPSGEKRP
jgi:hypothetical protein